MKSLRKKIEDLKFIGKESDGTIIEYSLNKQIDRILAIIDAAVEDIEKISRRHRDGGTGGKNFIYLPTVIQILGKPRKETKP